MSLTPGFGQTPLPHDELAALLPEVVVLGEPITRAALYDLEQGLQDRVTDELWRDFWPVRRKPLI